MNNNRGFTLIELLAVIAILAVLVVIAVPAVLDLFNSSKKNAFATQAQSLYKAAQQDYILSQMDTESTNKVSSYYSETTDTTGKQKKLNLSGGSSDIKYCIKFDSYGNIFTLAISDSNYSIRILGPDRENAPIGISEIDVASIKVKGTTGYKQTSSCTIQ